MKNLGLKIEKNRKKLWFSFLLNLTVLFLMLLLMHPWFETNDDSFIKMIVSGAMGEVDCTRTMCQHYFLGVFYNFLYRVFGNSISWYTLVQHVILLLSFTAITYVILNIVDNSLALCITGVVLMFFGYSCYISMQYTKTSGAATAAAAFLLFFSAAREKISCKGLAGAILLGTAGVLYRYNEFAIVLAFMTGIGIFLLLDIKSFPEKERVKRVVTGIAAYGLMAVIGAALCAADRYAYEQDPGWSYYMEYNSLRSSVVDYEVPDYEANKEALWKLGISENDYALYRSWNFNDTERVTADTWRGIAALQTEKPSMETMLKSYFKKFPAAHFRMFVFYGAMLILVLWIFAGKHSRNSILAAIYEILIFTAGYFFLYYKGRYLMNRVDTGLWLAFSLVYIWLLGQEKIRLSGKNGLVLLLGIFLFCQGTWSDDWRINAGERLEKNKSFQDIFAQIEEDKDHLYLAVTSFLSTEYFAPYDTVEKGSLENVVWLGGWETNMVSTNEKMQRYGVKNPFRDIVDNDGVYLLGERTDLIEKYIQEHYNADAKKKKVRKMGELTVYRFVTKK